LESIIIKLKNPNLTDYSSLNRQEHRWSAIYYLAVVALATGISILTTGLTWEILPFAFTLLINRRIFFEYSLKIMRGRPIEKIEGDQPLDILVRKVLGKNGGWKELFLLLLLLVIIYFVTFKLSFIKNIF
jgi:hypothetical protein